MMKVKFCGIRRKQDVEFLNQLMPDYCGFIFYEKSFRNVDLQTARMLSDSLRGEIRKVGVFVDRSPEEVARMAEHARLDLIQLHGREDEDYVHRLRDCVSLPLIKAVRFESTEAVRRADQLDVDYLLLDTYVKGVVGGTGKGFDWNQIPSLSKPYFLAGGIGVNNVSEAMKTNAYCLDVSSGIETDQVKDFEKMKQIMQVLKGRQQ